MIINRLNELENADFLAGVTMLVDKPMTWTSFDVVNKIRFLLKKKLGVRKIKVGHAGTLDPLATGLLIIAIGKDTKKINDYQAMTKMYSGTMMLGASTISYDAEFEPDVHFNTSHITSQMMENSRLKYIGKIEQVPPAFSAVKVDGKRAFKLAREGKTPELKSRMVEIFDFQLDKSNFPELFFEVHCSKGTYIRTLAHDFGKSLESGAYLTSLRRIAIGQYEVETAFSIEELQKVLS